MRKSGVLLVALGAFLAGGVSTGAVLTQRARVEQSGCPQGEKLTQVITLGRESYEPEYGCSREEDVVQLSDTDNMSSFRE